MRTFRDAKLMARALRAELAESGLDISHSRALEIVAAQFGLPDWNVLAARIGEAGGNSDGAAAFQGAVPLLRIFDLARAREFYTGWLGMAEDWEHRFGPDFPAYLQVSRSGLILHLTEHHGDASPGATAFVWMRGLDAFHAELAARPNPAMRPGIETWDVGANAAETTRIGMRVMEVIDPFGNRLRFAEPVPGDSPRPALERADAANGSDPGAAQTATTGGTLTLDAAKLEAFRRAVLAALADAPGGLVLAELTEQVRERLPEALRGGGCKWWVTVARRDLQARGHVRLERHGRSHRACLAP
jgi:catechol 2,3-dioxygenase-like lactoylglutathione lyase family enzyme